MTIQEINAAARSEGLSYGQYVDRHRGEPHLAAPENPLVRHCPICGACFRVRTEKNPRIYCSDLCYNRARYSRAARPDPPPRPCARCGRSFSPSKYASHQRYCSELCQRAGRQAELKEATP